MNYNSQTRSQPNLLSSGKFWVLTLMLILLYSVIILAQNTIYIDPTNSGDPAQNGSIDHPYDAWNDFTIQSNTTYLMKRGTACTNGSSIYFISKTNVTISTYGDGDRPQITYIGGNANINADGCTNLLIEGLKLVGGESGVISCGAHGGRSASNQTIRDCETVGGWRGINSEVWEPETGHISDLLIENCIVHGQSTDGIFAKSNGNETYNNITIRGCHVYDVNQKWLEFQNGTCDGDCIHLLRANNVLIEDCILDRRGTSYKFALIVIGLTYTENAIIRNNTLFPPNQHDVWSSNAIYFQILGDVQFIGNKIIGSQMPAGEASTACGVFRVRTADISYNLFDHIGYIAGSSEILTYYINNNTVNFYLQGNETFFFQSANKPVYLKNNIFLMPQGTSLVNDGMNGGVNVFKTNNIELYSNDISYFDDQLHFENIYANDFHITENSTPARNQGIEYTGAMNFDLDSVPVPQEITRDIGTFEYTDGSQTNNNPPVIGNQTFSVAENSAAGTNVGTVVASDPDAGQTLTYSILSGNTGNAFQINASTGVLTVATPSAINFEVTPTFSLVVKVQDNGSGSLSSQATMTVNLTNVNENPVIGNQTFSVAENSASGTNVGTIVASDPDAGQTLTYSILSGNTGNAFQINASTGVLTVATSSAINFEVTPTFSLVVKVQDNGTGSLSSQATMTVNLTNINENPVIGNQTFSVAENSAAGTNVGTVVASDPDAGQTLTYSILSGNTGNAFQINASTGVLTVATPSAINFEVTPTFSLVVKVQDNGTGSLSSQATMTINLTNVNENPVIGNQTFSVAENSAAGTNVGTVVASDPDAGQTLTYSILSGNTGNAFQINASTGVLTVATPSAINFEVTPTFSLVVKVQDNGTGSLSSQATMTVNLTNVNENPVIGNQTFSVAENSTVGTTIGTVVATDPDAGQTLSYSIVSGNNGNAFQINASTGLLTVLTPSALYSYPSFALIVEVQDNGSGNLTSQATMTIMVTDVNQPPVINNQVFSVTENSSAGTSVGTVVASDPDAGQTLTYSILSGNTDNAFQINASTGVLTVATPSAINFEVTPTFSIVVMVQDNGTGSLSSQATMTINLTNVNENPVIGNQTFSVAENSASGTNVGTVVASDPDAGQTLTYSILSGNTGNAFQINASTGVLTVATPSAINFEITPTFSLVVKVQDNGTGSLSSQATMTVNLTNVNENPVIGNQTFSVAENSAAGTNVGTVVASDPDAGQMLTYSILSGNTWNAFQINASTGELTVATPAVINFEVHPIFSLVIKVQDNGAGSLFSQATITVNLIDVNENPVINNQAFSVTENSASGSTVGTVIASDPDAGQTLTYSIVSGNTNNAFQINGSNGFITVATSSAINFEFYPVFSLVVRVQDNGTGSLFSQATVTVAVVDINESPVIAPQCFWVQLDISAIINETGNTDFKVGYILASDPDAGQSLTYSIAGLNGKEIWEINPVTGELLLVNQYNLNFVEIFNYNLFVKVEDNSPNPLFATTTVMITVHILNWDAEFETGESDISSERVSFNIFPNPATDHLNLMVKNLTNDELSLRVINMNGELVLRERFDGIDSELMERININNINKGSYIIEILSGGNQIIRKFIKM